MGSVTTATVSTHKPNAQRYKNVLKILFYRLTPESLVSERTNVSLQIPGGAFAVLASPRVQDSNITAESPVVFVSYF